MSFLIVTGMSGAGKSSALKFLEDIGYYCIDNIPPALIDKFAQLCFRPGFDIERVALGVDIRMGKLFADFLPWLKESENLDYQHSMLYLDANNEALMKRYKESRRVHPLEKNERLVAAIEKERELLIEVKRRSKYIIDTSYLMPRQLKEQLNNIFLKNTGFSNIIIKLLSFGFKHGAATDCDLVFDLRFLPNPFYVPELKQLTGNDPPVKDFVMRQEAAKEFLVKLIDMLEFLLPKYIAEGKNQLVIGIGCTGGKHRSVSFVNHLEGYFSQKGYLSMKNHRDLML